MAPTSIAQRRAELIATAARLNNALRRLGSAGHLFIEARAPRRRRLSRTRFPEPLSWLVDEERRATFEDSGNHFESGYPDAGVPAARGIARPRARGCSTRTGPPKAWTGASA